MATSKWTLLGLSVLLAGMLAAVAAAGPSSGPPGLAQAITAKEAHADELFGHDGVVGVGVGTRDGKGIVVVLTARDGVVGIPRSLDGVEVVVQVSGPISALVATSASAKPGVNPASYFDRPVPIGVSTGRADQCSAGTIGARVTNGSDVYALSANHVYANENDANVGDQIVQPGLYDAGKGNPLLCLDRYSTDFNLGTLSDWSVITFDGSDNTVDAAIAQTTTGNLDDATPSDGYGTPSSTTVPVNDLEIGDPVQKYGRSTSLTQGTICILDLTVNVGYSSGTAHFVDQIGVCGGKGPFIKSGDSGSLLVTDDGNDNPVGLIFASGVSNIAFANPIDDVLTALGVTIDGS
jgi:hypothetical protein